MAAPRYRIHPAIGIARVGNAPADQFFVGPERPGQSVRGVPGTGTMVPGFKDSGGLVKRQAARFHIFEYVEKGGIWTVSREITAGDAVSLRWTVHLANRKASFYTFDGLAGSPLLAAQPPHPRRNAAVLDRRSLDVDPLPRSISGKSAAAVAFRRGTSATPARERWPVTAPVLDYLGELRTDAAGRLLVIGGAGGVYQRPGAAPIQDYANNDGWFDDVSDGPVTAELVLKVGGTDTKVPVQGAWVLVGPPDLAPDLKPMVTLYDLLFDVAARGIAIPPDEAAYRTGELSRFAAIAADLAGGRTAFTSYKVSFDDDVLPILRQAVHSSFVFGPAKDAHVTLGAGSAAAFWPMLSDPAQPGALRAAVVSRLRRPGTPGLTPPGTMPKLLGDDPYNARGTGRWGLTLTPVQLAVLDRWAAGAFTGTALPPASLIVGKVQVTVTPHGLDQAALENCSGGAFFPGIEVGWQIREPALFAEPFRLRHGAPSRYIGDNRVVVGAGHFTRQMALPWLADFLQCRTERQQVSGEPWGWWPSQRPDQVYPDRAQALRHHNGGTMQDWTRATGAWPPDAAAPPGTPAGPSFQQFIQAWWKLGIVTSDPAGVFYESERAGSIP